MSLGRVRTKQILIRVTFSEHHQLTESAQISNLGLAPYLRQAGLIQARVTRFHSLQQQVRQLAICLHRIYQFHQGSASPDLEIDTVLEQVLILAHRIEQEVNFLSPEDDCQNDRYR